MNRIGVQVQNYMTQDFKNIYRQIKSLSLLNQLYDSDAITHQQFQNQEKQILGRFKRLQMHLSEHDLLAFAKLYNIQKQFKRINNQSNSSNNMDKQLMSVCLTLGSKFPQINDTIHASKETRQVRNVLNLLSQITILLAKYRRLIKKSNPQLIDSINKLQRIYQECKKKNVNDQFTAMEYYQLEDAIQKLWLQFSTFS